MNEKPLLLYVDDEPINLMLLKQLLKDNYEVLTAPSGMEAIKIMYDERNIRIVVSDMKMPEMNGIEFIRKVRNDFPDTLFFILTGFECTPEITTALESNVIARYFSKPLDINVIISSIEEFLVK